MQATLHHWLNLEIFLWITFFFFLIAKLCVRKTPPKIGPNRLILVLWKHNTLQINAFIFSKNLHNPEVPGSNPGLATWKSRTYVKSWVLCCFCVRFAWGFAWGFCYFLIVNDGNTKLINNFFSPIYTDDLQLVKNLTSFNDYIAFIVHITHRSNDSFNSKSSHICNLLSGEL